MNTDRKLLDGEADAQPVEGGTGDAGNGEGDHMPASDDPNAQPKVRDTSVMMDDIHMTDSELDASKNEPEEPG